MYTVIIAERKFMDLCEELSVFLKPLLTPEIVFCEWDRNGRNLEEMLPDLKKLTEFHREWRALIVNQDGLEKVNPFDYTGYRDAFTGPEPHGDMEKILQRRDARFASFEQATANPLTRLTTALTGIPSFNYLIEDDAALESLLSGETDLRAYMLRSQLADLNLLETAVRLESFGKEQLLRFCAAEQVDELIDGVRTGDADKILSIVPVEDLPGFISQIGNSDVMHSDVDYNESLVENTVKNKILSAMAKDYKIKDTEPCEVLCFSPRTCDYHRYLQRIGGFVPDETRYSRFAEYNLYHEKIRFMVYDLVAADSNLYATEQMKMVACLLAMAANEFPPNAMVPTRVYAVELDMDEDAVRQTFSDYLGRLKATSDMILDIRRDLDRSDAEPLDDHTSRKLFETDMRIPVEINAYKRTDFHVLNNQLGLSNDCPQEETAYWGSQYGKIEKKFNRFLREPRRAVRTAVAGPFRDVNRVSDERIFRLSEYQREDVEIKMLDEEWEMVQTNPPGLMNDDAYKKQMSDADGEVRKEIAKRMTKAKTLIFGGIAVAAYAAGFIPLFFGNLNNAKSFLFCLLLTLVSLAVFAGAGMGFLYLMRKRLKKRFDQFNSVISGILSQIEANLARVSSYLGHACNFMRGSSVIYSEESEADKKRRILAHHLNSVKEASDRATELFSKFMDCNDAVTSDAEPYLNDYTVMGVYDFPVPFNPAGRNVMFMQPGYVVTVPTDFVESIRISRVELYD